MRALPARTAVAGTGRPGTGVPIAALAAALLTVATLAGGALGWAARRRRRPLDGPPDPVAALEIEAELQEIIAEHRAADDTRASPARAVH